MRRGHTAGKKNPARGRKENQERNQNQGAALWLAWGIRFFMTAALAGNRILGGYAPFALGSVAAAGPGIGGFFALAGAVTGALALMEFRDALPFMASCVLVLAAATAFRGNRLLSSPRAVSVYTAALFLSVGSIYASESPDPGAAMIPCIAAAGLSGASAWFFWPLFHADSKRSASESVLFLAASVLLAMRNVSIAGLSFGRMLLCVLLAYTGFLYGPAAGTASGLCLGLVAELCAEQNGHTGLLAASLGLGGLLCGQYGAGRRHIAALCFLGGALTALLLTGDPLANPLLIECGTGMLIFLMLPEKLFRAGSIKSAAELESELELKSRSESGAGARQLRDRLNRAAIALRDLYESCGQSESQSEASRENPAVIFDRAAERVCRRCGRCDTCWKSEYTATFQAMNAAAPVILERGRAEIDDFSPAFTDHCHHLTQFLAAIDTELHAYLLRQRYRKQLDEVRRNARGQYVQLSDLLASVASGPDVSFQSAPNSSDLSDEPEESPARMSGSSAGKISSGTAKTPGKRIARNHEARTTAGYARTIENNYHNHNANIKYNNYYQAAFARDDFCRFGSVLHPKAGERVCGDTVISFRTDDGLWCLLLADGMGSGEAARRESALICRLLRQFLEVGIYPEAALRTLNSAMALRGSETGSFTTMDLCTFNPESGEAAFYKYGAAPSYLKKGVSIRRVTGVSLPVGLRDAPAPPDITRLRLDPGGFVVLISDGVADAKDDQWLQDMLSDWEGDDPRELADAILRESVRRRKSHDDRGILILYRLTNTARQV